MSKNYQNIVKKTKDKNLRILISLDNKLSTKILQLTVEKKIQSSVLAAWGTDKLIVICLAKKFYLYRIDKLDSENKEALLNLIVEVKKIKTTTDNGIKFCEFDIVLPLVILKDTFLVPCEYNNLLIGRDFSTSAVQQAIHSDSTVLVTKQLDGNIENLRVEDLHNIGTACQIREINKIDHKTFKVGFLGLYRIKMQSVYIENGIFLAKCTIFYEDYSDFSFAAYQKTYFVKLNSLKQKINTLEISLESLDLLIETDDPCFFVFNIIASTISNPEKRLQIMRANLHTILEIIISDVQEKVYYADLEEKIENQVKKKINDQNKKFFIREKIEALKKEINDDDPFHNEYMPKTKEDIKLYPEHVRQVLASEIEKLKRNPHGTDASLIHYHINWILSLPWYTMLKKNNDLNLIYKILDENHIGSEDVKQAFLETINIRNPNGPGSIILLEGPPGVGKTSIAKIFAKAIGVPHYEICLAGMSDSSKILGHGRTYVGALPGDIVYGLKHGGGLNMVFILDEIDKINQNSGKDPMQALIRALDPDHNQSFKDTYLEPELNLQNITWIVTANDLSKIPETLIDRCPTIHLNGYCIAEKVQIGHVAIQKHKENLLINSAEIVINPPEVSYIVENYTWESGVRKLSKVLETILKRSLIKITDKQIKTPFKLKIKDIDGLLKNSKYRKVVPLRLTPGVGVVMGLAYTSLGGTILFIQCVFVKKTQNQKEDFCLTGNIAKVMQESLTVVFGFIKSHAKILNINLDLLNEFSVHVHAPEGGIPKDGPSAGVTFCTSIISLFTNKIVRGDIAMTGEIELNGNILPIGGLVEKLNAAHRELCYFKVNNLYKDMTVFIPHGNKQNLENIHKTVLNDLTIIPVEHMQQLLSQVFIE